MFLVRRHGKQVKLGMKIGRNDPCHCGSGRKYKKCCLAKEEEERRAAPLAAQEPDVDEEPAEPDEESVACDPDQTQPTSEMENPEPAFRPDPEPSNEYPRPDEKLPELPPEEKKIIEAWWDQTMPAYEKHDVKQMLRQVELALANFPKLFVHLELHEEFLFELGGALGRLGRLPEYISLLQRLRREQRLTYSFCYGAYDSDIVGELLISGKPEEIPAYLDLFKEYPDAQPDYCHEICNMLAWRGQAESLYLLCETVALPMATSENVVGGWFALDWLTRREEARFLERGADAPVADGVAAIKELGERIKYPLDPKAERLRLSQGAYYQAAPAETSGVLKETAKSHLLYSFIAHMRRAGGISWLEAYFLGDLLLDYVDWCRENKTQLVKLRQKDIEAFAVRRSRQIFGVNSVILLAILQTMVWFADYLRKAGRIDMAEFDRIKNDCRALFETGRGAVDCTQPAYRLCPTFEGLIAALMNAK